MKAGEMFKGYQDMRQECIVLEFQIRQFEGISHEDVIESMTYSNPQEEKVQTSRLSDRTGKTAIRYRRVKERLDDDWYDSLLSRYQYLQEEIQFFEYAVTKLSGRLPEFVRDMVMDRMSWTELMSKYSVGHSMVGKYRKMAEKELNVLYEIREKQADSYMLS